MSLFNKARCVRENCKGSDAGLRYISFHACYLYACIVISDACRWIFCKFKNKYANFIQNSEIQHKMFFVIMI